MKNTKEQTLGEEIANAISHGIMALFGVTALILLIIKSETGREYLGAIIFGLSIIILYTMSTIYHAMPNGSKSKRVFKRLDHLSIYILIGGSFAPPLLLLPDLREPLFNIAGMEKGLVLFTVQWLLIIVGIVFKSVWIKKFARLHVFLYLAMGWSALVFVGVLLEYSKAAFYYVLFGGIAYSLGVIFYAFPKIKYFHFIWHIFTAIGTILQFIAFYNFLY
ncbi:MAG TPA: hypothetical protein GX012_00305 [Acholeplasma sp.]|nr:hypothetical protein [Acholeplasma sp.]